MLARLGSALLRMEERRAQNWDYLLSADRRERYSRYRAWLRAGAARARVHFFSSALPVRLDLGQPGISFHKVVVNEYSLFTYPDYTLPLAVQDGADRAGRERLDIFHVHYAVPHATAAYLAVQMLASIGARTSRRSSPRCTARTQPCLGRIRVIAQRSSTLFLTRMRSRPSRKVCAAKRSRPSRSIDRSR